MINLIIGIAIGAALTPFWKKIYLWTKDKIAEITNTTKGD